MALLLAILHILPLLIIPTISQSVSVELYAHGFDQPSSHGWYSIIAINNGPNLAKPADVNHPIGHTIALINELTGTLMDVIRFDTYYNSSADAHMLNYLTSITSIHTIVAIVTFDSVQYSSNTHALLQTWGCNEPEPAHRESFLFIGTPSVTYNPSWQNCALAAEDATPPYAHPDIPLFQTSNPTIYPTENPTQSPTTNEPTMSVSTTTEPTTNHPTTIQPTTDAPTTYIPTSASPTTTVPTSITPTTDTPTTNVPSSASPTTQVPSTYNPTTKVPTTNTPTIAGPTTFLPTNYPITTAPTIYTMTTAHIPTGLPTQKPVEGGEVNDITTVGPNGSSEEDDLSMNETAQSNGLIYIIAGFAVTLCCLGLVVFIWKTIRNKRNTKKQERQVELGIIMEQTNTPKNNTFISDNNAANMANNIQTLTPSDAGEFGFNLTNAIGVNDVLMGGTTVTAGGPSVDTYEDGTETNGDGTFTHSTGDDETMSDDGIMQTLDGHITAEGNDAYVCNINKVATPGSIDNEEVHNPNIGKDEFIIGDMDMEQDYDIDNIENVDGSDDDQVLECMNTTRM